MNLLSESTISYLSARGCNAVEGGRIRDEAGLTRFFRDSFPAEGVWTDESRAYLASLLECLCSMDEMLYRFYRAMCDLFRRFVSLYAASAPREDALWKDAIAKGDRLALVDPADLYPVPHKN